LLELQKFQFLSTPDAIPNFRKLLGDGSQWGISISYCEQESPTGIAGGLKIAANALGDDQPLLVVLGDNIFLVRDSVEISQR